MVQTRMHEIDFYKVNSLLKQPYTFFRLYILFKLELLKSLAILCVCSSFKNAKAHGARFLVEKKFPLFLKEISMHGDMLLLVVFNLCISCKMQVVTSILAGPILTLL